MENNQDLKKKTQNVKKQENISITTMKLMLQNKWVKVFKNGPSKIFGRESLKNLK